MSATGRAGGVLLLCLTAAQPAPGETLRPLVTEDAATLEDGQVELQLATEWLSQFESPTRPLQGSLVRAPIVGLNLGMGGRTELQLRAPLRQRFAPEGADARAATGDVTLAGKVRFLGGRELGPALGARVQVKLPNISEESAIGTDETDVTLELLGGLELGGARVVASIGYAILGDPAVPSSQNDKVVIGAGFLLPLGLLDVAGDLHGIRWGDQALSDEWSSLVGVARGLGPVRLDVGAGLIAREGHNSFLLTAGASLTLKLRH